MSKTTPNVKTLENYKRIEKLRDEGKN